MLELDKESFLTVTCMYIIKYDDKTVFSNHSLYIYTE